MSFSVFLLLIAAAVFHASWNIIVKSGSNKLFEIALNALGGGLGALFLLPFAGLPDPRCIPMLALSCLSHIVYYFVMAATYRVADLTLAYPVMRGCAPIFTALALSIMGYPISAHGWLAIDLLCLGILSLASGEFFSKKKQLAGIFLAICSSFTIMTYTLADGFGARLAQSSLTYTCWLYITNLVPIQLWVCITHRKTWWPYLHRRFFPGICGGLCGLASYGIAIWAMTKTSIALVGALRETSVIFGMILGVLFLHEKLTIARICAVLLVMAGAICIRL